MKSSQVVAKLTSENPGSNTSTTVTGWEYRAWIPAVVGYDPDGDCPTVIERKKSFKAPTEGEALRKGEEARRKALLEVEVSGPHRVPQVSYVSVELNDEIRAVHKQAKADEEQRIKENRVPTIAELIKRNVKMKEGRGQIERLTAETERQNLKRVELPTNPSEDSTIRIEPFTFGNIPINEATQAHLQEFIDSLARTKSARTGTCLSTKYIRNIVATIASAWATLETDEHYRRYLHRLYFSAKHLRFPKPSEKRPNIKYSNDEVEKLIAHCDDDWDKGLLVLCLSGLRGPGEPAACKWKDFSLKEDGTYIRVENQIQEINGRFHLKPTKTGVKGERSIPICNRFLGFLEPLRKQAERLGSEFVLCGKAGEGPSKGCISPNALQERFNRIKERAGITREGATLYALRHTLLTAYRKEHGTDLAMLMGGHTTPAMLNKHYDQSRSEERLAGTVESLPWAKVRATENSVAS